MKAYSPYSADNTPILRRVKVMFMSILSICDETYAVVNLTASAADAIQEMLDKRTGAAAVLDENRVVAGIFTERDVLQKLALDARKAADVPVREVMTTPVVMATSEISPAEALVVMVDAHHRHLPIVDDDGRLLGMLSMRHVLQAKVDDLTGQLHKVQHA
jgi:CBS domain-containing protein